MTKQLQDQYESIFAEMEVLKGKSNYVCAVDTNHAVDTAPCLFVNKLKGECWACDKCTYYSARNRSIVSKNAVFNYKMYMCLPEHLKKREYLICDEAAELEDELVSNFSVDVRDRTLRNLLPNFSYHVDVDNPSNVKAYLSELVVELYELIKELESSIAKSRKRGASQTEINRMLTAKNLHGQVKTCLEHWSQCEYITEKTKTGITICPLKVDKLSHTLFDNAEKVLLMSATIIDSANYAKSLGITDYVYIEIPSAFDPANAPIVVSSKYKMNRNNWETLMPTFKGIIEKICRDHGDVKGIIHTHNMDITNYMRENLQGDRFLFREKGIDNGDILRQHLDGKDNTVLVSPSMTHGVDLKDDLARFQIIVKAPFLPLNNKRIARLFKMDPQWYANKMLTTVIQASGRGIRNKDDHCATYILDGCIVQSILDNANKLPKYFIKRFL